MPGGAATDQPFRLKRSQAGIISCMSNDGREIKTYVCLHVFDGVRPVFYVTRPDGDWCALCGADHPDDAS